MYLYVRPLPCRWYLVVVMIIITLFIKIAMPTSSAFSCSRPHRLICFMLGTSIWLMPWGRKSLVKLASPCDGSCHGGFLFRVLSELEVSPKEKCYSKWFIFSPWKSCKTWETVLLYFQLCTCQIVLNAGLVWSSTHLIHCPLGYGYGGLPWFVQWFNGFSLMQICFGFKCKLPQQCNHLSDLLGLPLGK